MTETTIQASDAGWPNTLPELEQVQSQTWTRYIRPINSQYATSNFTLIKNLNTDLLSILNKMATLSNEPMIRQQITRLENHATMLANPDKETAIQNLRADLSGTTFSASAATSGTGTTSSASASASVSGIPSGTTNQAPPPPLPETITELDALYEQKSQAYEALLASPDADMKLADIKTLNEELIAIVNAIIDLLSKETTQESISVKQQDLLAKLRQLQNDYNQLQQQRDVAETLRRIRVDEQTRLNKSVYFYILIFLGVSLLILGAIFIASRWAQKSDIITPMPSNPSAMPPLT